jgi:cyclic pyranopterin monophosphate synthase
MDKNSVSSFYWRINCMAEFTHFNEEGRARMVDVSDKPETARTALAHSSIVVSKEIYEKISNNEMKKGDVLAVAQVAAVLAAKKTWDIIPMCHPIPLTGVNVTFSWEQEQAEAYRLNIQAAVKTKGNTGVEMEALTAASACALTVYDMCKAVDKGMVIGPTYLVEKTGGKNGDFTRTEPVK